MDIPGQIDLNQWMLAQKDDSYWHDTVCRFCNSQCSDFGGYPTYSACGYLEFKMGLSSICNVCWEECKGRCTNSKSEYYGKPINDIPLTGCKYYYGTNGTEREMEERMRSNEG